MAKRNGLENVYVHLFLDGRDTAPTSGKGFIEELLAKMNEIGVGKVASISGRYYAMDRDNRWAVSYTHLDVYKRQSQMVRTIKYFAELA